MGNLPIKKRRKNIGLLVAAFERRRGAFSKTQTTTVFRNVNK